MGTPSKYILHHYLYQKEAEDYRSYLLLLGYTKQTCQARYLYLKVFFNWLENNKLFEIKQITTKEITLYNCYVKNKISQRTAKPLKQKSVYDIMRTVQMYLGYALKGNKIISNPASYLKFNYPKEEVYRIIFNQDQIQQLYQVTQDLQEKAILHIAYGCGLRANEVSLLKKEDVRLTENIMIVQKGKNSKRRLVPISQKIADELQKFIESIEKEQKAVFINSKGNRMKQWTLNKILKALIIKTDFGKKFTKEELTKIGMHTLRHSIATHLLENGMPLEQVQVFLGHSHIESTKIYTHINKNQINELMQ